MSHSRSIPRARLAIAAVMSIAALALAGPAAAATPAPGWNIQSFATPTSFSTADNAECAATAGRTEPLCDTIVVVATNAGSRPVKGAPVTLTATIPAGLSVQKLSLFFSGAAQLGFGSEVNLAEKGFCTTTPKLRCSLPAEVEPDGTLRLLIRVTVTDPSAHGTFPSSAAITGGGAPDAITEPGLSIGAGAPSFGPTLFSSIPAGLDGTAESQAGGHPYELSTRIVLANAFRMTPEAAFRQTSIHDVRDVVVDLPVGLLGSAVATPRCTLAQLSSPEHCSPATVLGHISTEPRTGASVDSPIYNIVPETGQAAEFGYIDALKSSHVIYAHLLPTPSGYALQVLAPEVPQVTLSSVLVTFFGDPAEKNLAGNTPIAMFTNPADCSGSPLTTSVHVDSWQEPAQQSEGIPNLSDPRWASASTQSPPVTGCDLLQFAPSLSAKPDTTAADSPSGLSVELKVPQTTGPGTLATPPLKNATVTLPAGLTVDPSAAAGLASCTEAQIGWLGGGLTDFTPQAPTCPAASKIGSVQLSTPLLEGTLEGAIYLAAQDENPFHSLLAGYIVIDDPRTGIIVKIPGELATNPQTGQITGTFDQNPQLPFSDLKLRFFGGPRGDIATPEGCGTYTTTSELEPWSATLGSGLGATPSDSFQIDSGCLAGFTPAFTAGTLSPQAGAYSPFTLSLSRQDSEDGLGGLSVTLPTGLLAKIAGVAECPDAQLAAAAAHSGAAEQANPSCPSGSLLGSVQTAAGPGPNPTIVSGRAYLTGPYRGAPYGIAVIVPALAGPFDLGTVVIRQALYIDPLDAHVTDVSDPFPTILHGIPLRIQRVSVTLDRPQFTFNPTSCEPKSLAATVTSIPGAQAAVSSRFQAAGCATLPFKPSFSVSTAGHASKVSGASLDVKVASKGGPQPGGGEANIRSVKVALPVQLPSRLTTLQKACLAAVFEANPASCPKESNVGTATAKTPILSGPLTGPAYLVSHGGAAFPDLEIVLQGEGITLVLDGHTDIKKGITTSTFNTVPDAPISSFELNLPTGPFSVLGAYVAGRDHYNFCGQSLTLPTTISAQNGAVVTQTTKLGVTGCPPSVAISKTAVKGNSVAVTVKLGQQGTVKITGRGLRTTTKRGMKAGTRTITVPLTAVGRAAKRRHGKLKIQAALTVSGRTGTATATLKA